MTIQDVAILDNSLPRPSHRPQKVWAGRLELKLGLQQRRPDREQGPTAVDPQYEPARPRNPVDSHQILDAKINYGGRVTDDKDERFITTFIKQFINEELIDQKDKYA
eukprot:CAMPEP_0116895828 /NCGR_PEP_ID=MMETSP0467-20121206/5241_1 /TAXON_ID=283647 /ORGANISM="Mesodinium pulex, Strain SPMC105" /LENGTH=106 /DNA_ID=CAMNT_0004566727 /DNA_START=318 /DNA_END=640 /DNA_ORIENTATION=-